MQIAEWIRLKADISAVGHNLANGEELRAYLHIIIIRTTHVLNANSQLRAAWMED